MNFDPHILYEDNHIIVLIKPAGLLSQSDSTGDPNLVDEMKKYLKVKYNKPGNVYVGLMQRLDRPVEGILVLAKTSKAQIRLQEQISNRKFEKKYLMISHVHPDPEEGELVHYLIKDEGANKTRVFDYDKPKSKKCILYYKVLANRDKKCLMDINLFSGRSHQIRAQMAYIGCPVLGDTKYGGLNTPKYEMALYAYKLGIEHPVTKEKMNWTSYPPVVEPWRGFGDFFPA
jgi:23S rRNA pseudouridine1911/1915/1917 synthase